MDMMRADMSGVDELTNNLTHRVVIGDILIRGAEMYGDRVALVDGSNSLTYRELDARANALARGLLDRGLVRGDAIALQMANRWEFLVTFFGCAKIGVIVLPINTALTAREIAYQIVDSKVSAIVTEEAFLPVIENALTAAEGCSARFLEVVGTRPAMVAGLSTNDWTTLLDHCREAIETIVEDRDIVQCLYTSGTTSAPKGVLTSHVAVQIAVMNSALHLGLRPRGRAAVMPIVLPLFHVAGLNLLAMPMLLTGGTVILYRKFETSVILNDVACRGATHFMGHATMWRAFLDDPQFGKIDTTSLQLGIYAMAQIPPHMLERLRKGFPNADILLVSGQTEVTPVNEMQWPEHQGIKDNSWGAASVTTNVRIMGPDGQLLPRGQVGEIVYRSPQLMEGYWNNAEANRENFAHGWFHGGDVGYIDDEGVIWFSDRTKDMVKSGGENISSVEVERIIVGYKDVGECAVVGVSDERWGEAVLALVVLKPGAKPDPDALKAYCKEHLAAFKVPKRFEFVDSLPKTATGKVTKHLLRGAYS